jgi:hypothetical protein
MSEIIPPSEPGKELPSSTPPAIQVTKSKPPSKKVCTALGVLLFIVSSALAFVFPPLVLAGLIVAIVSLFFQGYRCVFLGYILTIGVLLLGAVIYCAGHPLRLD